MSNRVDSPEIHFFEGFSSLYQWLINAVFKTPTGQGESDGPPRLKLVKTVLLFVLMMINNINSRFSFSRLFPEQERGVGDHR